MNRVGILAKDLTAHFATWFRSNKLGHEQREVHEMLGAWLHAMYPNLAERRAAEICKKATSTVRSDTQEFAVDFRAIARALLRLSPETLAKN